MKYFLSVLFILALILPAQGQVQCKRPHQIRAEIEKAVKPNNVEVYFLSYDAQGKVVKRDNKIYPSSLYMLVAMARNKVEVYFFKTGCVFATADLDPADATQYFLHEFRDLIFPAKIISVIDYDSHRD